MRMINGVSSAVCESVDTSCSGTLHSKPAYERFENSDWSTLEKRWDRGHIPGDAPVYRGDEHDRDFAQIWCEGGSAHTGEGRAHFEWPEYPGVLPCTGRREVLVFQPYRRSTSGLD